MYHSFDTDLAKKYGILEAILIQFFGFWISKNEANEIHFHDGRYWTFNTQKAMLKLFPYATRRTLDTAIKKLKDEGLLITGNYNQSAYDRTTWYALSETCMSMWRKCEMEMHDSGNGFHKSATPIPVNNTVNNTDIKRESILTDTKEKAPRFVPPTVEEVQAYCDEKGYELDAQRFIDYYESQGWRKANGLKLTSWKAAVGGWASRDKAEKKKQRKPEIIDDFDYEAAYEEDKRKGLL